MEKNGAGRENSVADVIGPCSHEVRELLDGEAEPAADGFHCQTATRVLFVHYSMATDAATALLICRERGLLLDKIERMTSDLADFLFATTITERLADN